MDVRLMGNVEIHDGAQLVPLARTGERCVLASLALELGRRIHVDTLVDRLWGDDPPAGADHTIASYIRTVRKAIEDAGGRREWVKNHRPGIYQLNLDPSLVDYHRFATLLTQARMRQRDAKPADAAGSYRKALELRTAEALSNVTGQWAVARRYAIEQEHLDAVCELYELQLAIGEYTAVATHATNLIMDIVPTDRMIVLAVRGLARSGQRAIIPGFLSRASKRMWDTAQARPSPQVLAIARQLVADPDPRPFTRTAAVSAHQPDRLAGDEPVHADSAQSSSADDGEPDLREPTRDGAIVMMAEHNHQVYQAAGDQYIAEA